MNASRHRCLVAVEPRLLGDALARVLPVDRFEVVMDGEDAGTGAAERFPVVITSFDGQEAPTGTVTVTLAGDGADVTGIDVVGPGPGRRHLTTVDELLTVLVGVCDELGAV